MTVCGIKCVELTKDSVRILGVFYSYNEKLKMDKKFLRNITNIECGCKI